MDYIMVTLRTEQGASADLKVPAFVSVDELIVMLREALSMPDNGTSARLQAEPLGRILVNHRTLGEEGVTQGALLTIIG